MRARACTVILESIGRGGEMETLWAVVAIAFVAAVVAVTAWVLLVAPFVVPARAARRGVGLRHR